MIRSINVEVEYDNLALWWTKRGLVAPAKLLLEGANGFAASTGETDMIAAFMYVSSKGIVGIVEWVIGNPDHRSHVFEMADSLRILMDFMSEFAKKAGCSVLFMSTQQEGSVSSFILKRQWQSCDGEPHQHFLKIL